MRVVLVTVMGTAVPNQYEQEVLLPYAHKHFAGWLDDNKYEPRIIELLESLHLEGFISDSSADSLIARVQVEPEVMESASGPFRKLIHKLLDNGYQEGDIEGEIFEDAWQAMHEWGTAGIPVYSYGRGLVSERRSIFKHSIFGDLSSLFKGHFDPTIGDLSSSESFLAIANKIEISPLFCTCIATTKATLQAAQDAGMDGLLLDRSGAEETTNVSYPIVKSFDEIVLPDDHVLEVAS
jgi:enolase-phosphatase E1